MLVLSHASSYSDNVDGDDDGDPHSADAGDGDAGHLYYGCYDMLYYIVSSFISYSIILHDHISYSIILYYTIS